jgi:hypothetical protein
MKNNPNPGKSTLLEYLLVLSRTDKKYLPIAEEIQKNPRLQKQIDDQVKGKLYADKSVNWLKLSNYIAEPATYCLSGSATQVLMLLAGLMSQGNNLIQASNMAICQQLHIAKNTCNSALKELITQGYIAIYQPAKSHQAAIYMINPRVATCGKTSITLQQEYDDIADPQALIAFQKKHNNDGQLQVAHKWTEEQGHDNKQRYNSLEISKKKEPSD